MHSIYFYCKKSCRLVKLVCTVRLKARSFLALFEVFAGYDGLKA